MTVKTVKVRKEHKCDVCQSTIKPGETADHLKTRVPTGAPDEGWGFSQDGIKYLSAYRHTTPCDTPDGDEYNGYFRWYV